MKILKFHGCPTAAFQSILNYNSHKNDKLSQKIEYASNADVLFGK